MIIRHIKINAFWLCVSMFAPGWCGPAGAQATATGSADESSMDVMVEVIVTAERRDRNLQTTPISASVLFKTDYNHLDLSAYCQTDDYNFLPGESVIGVPERSTSGEYCLEGKNPKTAKAVWGQATSDLTGSLELAAGPDSAVRHSSGVCGC